MVINKEIGRQDVVWYGSFRFCIIITSVHFHNLGTYSDRNEEFIMRVSFMAAFLGSLSISSLIKANLGAFLALLLFLIYFCILLGDTSLIFFICTLIQSLYVNCFFSYCWKVRLLFFDHFCSFLTGGICRE